MSHSQHEANVVAFLILLFGFVFVATMYLPVVRNKRWSLLLWAPIVTFDILTLLEIFHRLPHWVAIPIVGGILLFFAAPFIIVPVISLIVAAFAFPRRVAWNSPYVITAAAVSIAVFYGVIEFTLNRVNGLR